MNKKEEIFTIGDKCEKGIISSFSIFGNDLLITYDNGSTQPLKNAIKSKVLFRTEDGVDIYEGDNYWVVPKKYIYESTVCSDYEYHAFDLIEKEKNLNQYNWDNFWSFSSKENAEEFILMNKPCLSVKDILKRFNSRWSEVNETTLKELVKSKL